MVVYDKYIIASEYFMLIKVQKFLILHDRFHIRYLLQNMKSIPLTLAKILCLVQFEHLPTPYCIAQCDLIYLSVAF
jgi:hypothetical protein